jgi:hypothetical protein
VSVESWCRRRERLVQDLTGSPFPRKELAALSTVYLAIGINNAVLIGCGHSSQVCSFRSSAVKISKTAVLIQIFNINRKQRGYTWQVKLGMQQALALSTPGARRRLGAWRKARRAAGVVARRAPGVVDERPAARRHPCLPHSRWPGLCRRPAA